MLTELPKSSNSTSSAKLRIRKIPRPFSFSILSGEVGSGKLVKSKPDPSYLTLTQNSFEESPTKILTDKLLSN